MKNNLANYITILRFLSIFSLAYFLERGYYTLSAIIYLIAAFSDIVDGYIVRKQKNISNFGTLMDPIPDKLMYLTALIIFIQRGYTSFLSVLIVSFREILITALRSVCYLKGKTFPAAKTGKIKAFIQQISFFIILAFKNNMISTITVYVIVLITLQLSFL